MKRKRITVAIDIDGVIRDSLSGELTEGALVALDWVKSKGHKIILMTANKGFKETKEWLLAKGINYPLQKKPRATMYFDNRAIRFRGWNDLTSYL